MFKWNVEPEISTTVFPKLDLVIATECTGYIQEENVELLRTLVEKTLTNQFDGSRAVVTRMYAALGQSVNLAVGAVGAACLSSGAVSPASGWINHLGVTIGLFAAASVWLAAASAALLGVLPRQIGGLGINASEAYTQARLSSDPREFQLGLIRHFHATWEGNKPSLAHSRSCLGWCLKLTALAPLVGVAVFGALRLARVTLL